MRRSRFNEKVGSSLRSKNSVRKKVGNDQSLDQFSIRNTPNLHAKLLEKYKRFSCATMHRQVFVKLSADAPIQPFSQSIYASVLLADISGFTRLSSRLSAEELKFHINEYFSLLLGVVIKNGGDVIKFLGDAVLIMWPVECDADYEVKNTTVLMASLCALQLLKDCSNYERGEGKRAVSLKLHCGISCGLVHLMNVGVGDRWEFFISGEPLNTIGTAVNEAGKGEVCLTAEAYGLIADKLDGRRINEGNYVLTGKCVSHQNIKNNTSYTGLAANTHCDIMADVELKSASTSAERTIGSNAAGVGKRPVLLPHTQNPGQSDEISNDELTTVVTSTAFKPPAMRRRSSLRRTNSFSRLTALQEIGEHDHFPFPVTDSSAVVHGLDTASTGRLEKGYGRRPSIISSIEESSGSFFGKSEDSPLPGIDGRLSSRDSIAISLIPSSGSLNHQSRNSSFFVQTPLGQCRTPSLSGNGSDMTLGLIRTIHGIAEQSTAAAATGSANSSQCGGMVALNRTISISSADSTEKPSAIQGHGSKGSLQDSLQDSLASFKRSLTKPITTSVTHSKEGDTSDSSTNGGIRSTIVKAISRQFRQKDPEIRQDPFDLLAENNYLLTRVRHYLNGFLSNECASSDLFDDEFDDTEVVSRIQVNTATALRNYVHESARSALEGSGAKYMFELRTVTTIFIEILNIQDDLDEGRVEGPQYVMSMALSALTRYGGSLRQFTVDDKGCVLIIAFGLPGATHEDNAMRALETSIAIRRLLMERNIQCKIGISEGKVYCGLVGSFDRCEYAMMGASVNLAARLMGKCSIGDILVGEGVYRSTMARFVFETLGDITVKGYDKPVAMFKPKERASNNSLLGVNEGTNGDMAFIGRSNELHLIQQSVENCKNNDTALKILVEGESQVGKTRLVVEAVQRAKINDQSIRVLIGAGAATSTVSYNIIRQILEQLMGLDTYRDLDNQQFGSHVTSTGSIFSLDTSRDKNSNNPSYPTSTYGSSLLTDWIDTFAPDEYITEEELLDVNSNNTSNTSYMNTNEKTTDITSLLPVIQNSKSMDGIEVEARGNKLSGVCSVNHVEQMTIQYPLKDLLPLLGHVLGFTMTINGFFLGFDSSRRETVTEKLLLRILLIGLRHHFDVLLVDNLQWADSPSVKVLKMFTDQMDHGVFIGINRTSHGIETIRLISSALTPFISYLRNNASVINLLKFDASTVRLLIENVMGPTLVESHPHILSEENIRSLMERSGRSPLHVALLANRLKEALIAGNFLQIQDLPVGDHSVAVERFDRLSHESQVVLKIASVIGTVFSDTVLRHTLVSLSFEAFILRLGQTLRNLMDHSIIAPSITSNDDYKFIDRSIQESVYNLMLATQRGQVHGIVAEFLESRYGDTKDRLPDIVRHYCASDNIPKKIQYLLKSAETALVDKFLYLSYNYYTELISLVTGKDFDDLLTKSSADGKLRVNRQILSYYICWNHQKVSQTRLSRSGARLLDQLSSSEQQQDSGKWFQFEDIKWSVMDSLAHPVPEEALGSWMSKLGLLQFKLGRLRESNNALVLALRTYNISLVHKEGILHRLFGTSEAENWEGFSIEKLEDICECIKHLAWLMLLRGYPEDAHNLLKYGVQMIRPLTSNPRFSSNQILYIKISEKFRHMRAYATLAKFTMLGTGSTSNRVADLHMQHQDSGSNSQHFRSIKNRGQSNITAAASTVPIATPNSNASKSEIILVLCAAHNLFCCGELGEASALLTQVQDSPSADAHQDFQSMALLGKNWILFLLGCPSLAKTNCTQALRREASRSHFALHLWTLELDIVMKATERDFDSGEISVKMLQTVQRRQSYRATTAAAVAYFYSSKGLLDQALPLALQACRKISLRKQCIPTVLILLSLAIYTLFSILESSGQLSKRIRKDIEIAIRKAMECLSDHTKRFSVLEPFYITASIRLFRLEGKSVLDMSYGHVKLLTDLKATLDVNRQCIFGNMFMHHQSFLLYSELQTSGLMASESNEKERSKSLALSCYRMFGHLPSDVTLNNMNTLIT